MKKSSESTKNCEASLLKSRNYCVENNIFPGWPTIANRLLSRPDELREAYCDIHEKVNGSARQLEVFFDALCCAACAWDEDSRSNTRAAKKQLEDLNKEIPKLAYDLSCLLEKRNRLENAYSLGGDTHYHIVQVIDNASAGNGLYQSWLKEELSALARRFDLKYWPSLSDVVEEIARDCDGKKAQVRNQITAAAIKSKRPSKADFCRALLERVNQSIGLGEGYLPQNFSLKDESWASLVNCILDLCEKNLIDGAYIKNLRHKTKRP